MTASQTYRGIMVGVDGSPASNAAVNWAAREAARRNVPLTLVHVINAAVATWPETPKPLGDGQ
jgi:nucleotide-binding universal stress UspA family protein